VAALLAVASAIAAPRGASAELQQIMNVDLRRPERREAVLLATRAAEELIERGDAAAARALAERGIEVDSKEPWVHYQRALAFVAEGRVDLAVASFRAAEARYERRDLWGRSVAIWGRAWALANVTRCEEARVAYADYARAVERADRKAADLARQRARECGVRARRTSSPKVDK
jgi:hypothetical protein